MNIQVHIERLVVDEALIGSGDRRQLEAAVIAELSQLLTTHGLQDEWRMGATLPLLRGGEIAPARNGVARGESEWGQQIGRAVYQGLEPSTRK